jgi:hypothetical protein
LGNEKTLKDKTNEPTYFEKERSEHLSKTMGNTMILKEAQEMLYNS